MTEGRRIAFIGFGEAARAFAQGWRRDAIAIASLSAYDVKLHQSETAGEVAAAGTALAVALAANNREALAGADMAISLVPADQTVMAAAAAAPVLPKGVLWVDATSSAPQTKRAAAGLIEAGGGRYVDLAIMAPVHPRLHRTPTLIAGPQAGAAAALLRALGMDPVPVDGDVGSASAIKMIRSVMIKGLEALTSECLLAARVAGVEEAVLRSLEASDPDIAWRKRALYNLERMSRHGLRRAAEMREAAATLRELGIPDRMALATIAWQDQLGALGEDIPASAGLNAALDAVLATLP